MLKKVSCPSPHHAGNRGSSGVTPFILNLGTRWRQVASFMHWQLYLQVRTPVPTEYQKQFGWYWITENLSSLLELKPWTIQPVASHYTDYIIPTPWLANS